LKATDPLDEKDMAGSTEAEQDRLRTSLRRAGFKPPQIAAQFAEKFDLRPRAAWRLAMGWPQWKLVQEYRTRNPGHPIGQNRISEWESWPYGGKQPSLLHLGCLVLAFGHGCTVADLVDDADLAHLSDVERQFIDTTTKGDGRAPFGAPVYTWANAGAVQSQPSATAIPIGPTSHAATMEAFRTADRQVGGGHLYAVVMAYLTTNVSGDLVNASTEPSAFTAAAALSEMAGWMAHDAGGDTIAAQHFARAVSLAEVNSEPQVMAHLLASSAHLALHQHDPHRAATLAGRGLHGLEPAHVPGPIRARLLAMQARATAQLGDAKSSVASLAAAETALTQHIDKPLSPWVSRFDEASLAMEAARALRIGGDLTAAREHAERVIALRPADRARARALGQLMLATTNLDAGRADEAAVLALEALAATRHLGSHVVTTHLRDISSRLSHIDSPGVVRDAAELIQAGTPARPFPLGWTSDTSGMRSTQ
jgi:hypothetical protein